MVLLLLYFQDLIYISHSMSREQLQYIFKVVLPSDLEEKQILDVGSRLGAVLYGVSTSLRVFIYVKITHCRSKHINESIQGTCVK